MSKPIRYTQNIKCVEPSYLAQNIQSGMVECSIGEWVLHSDYARLKEEVKRLTEKVRKIAAEVIKERKSAEDWHARMTEDYHNPNGSAIGQDVVEASASLQAWEKAEELLKDFAAKEGKPSV